MTDFPKAPSTGGHASDSNSDDVFDLDDVDFQRVDPTGKFKVPAQTIAQASMPVSSDPTQIVTGEISVENTPAPQARPTSQTPTSPPAAAPKNARAALQEALAQLQKNKQANALAHEPTPAPGASTPRPQSQTQSSGGFAIPQSPATLTPQTDPTQTVAAPPPQAAQPIENIAPQTDAAPAKNAPDPGAPPPAAQTRSSDAWRARNPPARATTPQEELTPLPGPAPTAPPPAAPWQAAITSEVALVPAEMPAPSDAMPAAAAQDAQDQAAMRITGEMQVTDDASHTSQGGGGRAEPAMRMPTPASLAQATVLGAPLPASLAPPPAAAPPPAVGTAHAVPAPANLPPLATQAPPPARAARLSLADQARAAKGPQATSAPRPSLADQARMARGPAGVASRPPPATSYTPMNDGEVTTPSEFRGAPQDLPFQKPLLTPLAGGPEAVKGFVSTTAEVAFNDALPPVPTFPAPEQAPPPPPAEPPAPAWTLQAPHEEAPAMMNLLTSEPHTPVLPPPAVAPVASIAEPPATLEKASTLAEPLGPVIQRDDLDPMGMPTLEALADGAAQAADHKALTRDITGTADARSPTEPFPPSALPVPPGAKLPLKRVLPLAAGAAALLCMAVVLVVRHHAAPPPVRVDPIAKAPTPAKPKEAHKDKVHAPKPVVPQVTEPLTDETVDRLGYRALAVGVEALANNPRGDPGLLLWAQWRLASHFEDPGAQAALARVIDDLPLRGRVDVSSPLLTAAQAGAAITLGRIPLAKRLIIALAKSPGAKMWQTWYVQTVWQARRALPPTRLIAQLDRILRASPNNADARLWRAEALLRRNLGEGARVLAELARHKDPDVIARVASVYTRFGLTQALPGVLEPLGDGSSILQAAPAHQTDLLRLFTASRVLRGDYEAPRTIAEALARGDGDAPAVATWARLTQYEDDDPGSVLQQGIDAQSDKSVRGWLLYEAVRLALERHDMNHAKFLADGMNSMQPGDIGVFAPLAAAKVEWARNQQKQAKHQLANAQAADPNNRYVQIALATFDTSTPEVPVRWTGAPPVPPEILWQRAHATAAVGQGSAAARIAEEIFWRDPTLFDPVVLLGAWSGWLDQAGEALRAESLLERIVPALPDDDRPVIQLIKQARRGKRYDAAIQWYEVLLKRRPSDPELTVELAKTYIDAQQPEVAARVLSAAEHANPNVRTPVFMTTMAGALSKSDPTKARNLLAVALRVQPSRDSYVLLADMENAAGHPEEELRALQAALPLAPDDGPLHLRVASSPTRQADEQPGDGALAAIDQQCRSHGDARRFAAGVWRHSRRDDRLPACRHSLPARRHSPPRSGRPFGKNWRAAAQWPTQRHRRHQDFAEGRKRCSATSRYVLLAKPSFCAQRHARGGQEAAHEIFATGARRHLCRRRPPRVGKQPTTAPRRVSPPNRQTPRP